MKHLLLTLICFASSYLFAQVKVGKERLDRLKKGVVAIVIDNNRVGTGFFISTKQIATCYHVVFGNLQNKVAPKKIQIIKEDSILIDVVIPNYFAGELKLAQIFDYCLLEIRNENEVKKDQIFLKLGNFKNVEEGDWVISCGYPLGIQQPFVSVGLFSSKWKNVVGTMVRRGDTTVVTNDCGWMDVTINHGNSGGPILILGNTPQDDLVIGIASFILNPFANSAVAQGEFASKSSTNVSMGYNGVNQLDVNAQIFQAIANTSFGISGCSSIDNFRRIFAVFK